MNPNCQASVSKDTLAEAIKTWNQRAEKEKLDVLESIKTLALDLHTMKREFDG